MRVHKTKENVNGTFSIGKTWNLDDLSAIESFTGPNVSPDFRAWAGDNGFVVTMGKPYYWEAQTDREKKFFIASMIKIYGKYTGGRVPALSNFDQRELDQVLGGASRRTPSAQPTPTLVTPSPSLPPQSPAGRPAPPPSPRRPPLPDPSTSNLALSSASGFDGGSMSGREGSRTPSRSPMPNGTSSPASLAPSFDSTRNMRTPQDASFKPDPASRQEPPLRQRLANNNVSQDSVSAYRSGDESLRPRSRGRPNGINPGVANAPEPPPSGLAPAFVPTPNSSTEKPPERKRPPMDPSRPTGAPPDENLVPAPLSNMAARRDPSRGPSQDRMAPSSPVAPPPRSIDRMSPRKPTLRGQLFEASPPMAEPAATLAEPPPRLDTAPPPPVTANGTENDSPTVPVSASAATETSDGSPISPEEDNRPGLGPMIKARKGKPKNDLAAALWKTAAAAKAFKPRAGGAGEKLLKAAQTTQTNGPDGITAVVPAPRRPEPEKKQESAPQTPEVPELRVSNPDGKADMTAQAGMEASKPGPKKIPQPEPQDERKRSMVVGNDMKYLTTLGVDPSILDTKTTQFTEWLDFFSWVPGDKMRSLNFDDMKIDLDRELNKAQAGGWLARFEEEDERVDGIKKGIDTAMEECEELDNLLTLYGVELSVGLPSDMSLRNPISNNCIDSPRRHCLHRGSRARLASSSGQSKTAQEGVGITVGDMRDYCQRFAGPFFGTFGQPKWCRRC